MKTTASIFLVLFFLLVSAKSFSQSNTKSISESKPRTGLTKKVADVDSKDNSNKIDSIGGQKNVANTKATGNPNSNRNNTSVSSLKATHKASKKMANSNFNKK